MITYMRAWMSSKFSQIWSGTTELAALEHLKNWCCPFFSFHSCGYTWEIVRWAFTGPLVLWFGPPVWGYDFCYFPQIVDSQRLISERISFDNLSEEYAREDEIYRTKIQKVFQLVTGVFFSHKWLLATSFCLHLLFRKSKRLCWKNDIVMTLSFSDGHGYV